jgi:hypothetical protein
VRPGLWSQGARNLDWWLEFYPEVRTRVAAGGPLLHERYVASGLTFSPSTWWTLLSTDIVWGDLADAAASRVRRGARWNFSGKLRLLRPLELEPSLSLAWLRPDDGGADAYREQAMQWLAVWHFDAQHSLRAIAQRVRFDRRAEPPAIAQARERSHTESLTYAWRRSAGTVFYLGATRQASRSLPATDARTTEAFVKLQFDLDEVRSAW